MKQICTPVEVPSWLSNDQWVARFHEDFYAGLDDLPPCDKTDPNHKPDPLCVNPANIPQELKEVPQWVCWKYEWDGTRWTKPPYHPNGYRASKTNPKHFSNFERVMAAYKKGGFDGIGFVLTDNDPFVAIDIDDCLNGNVLTDEARDIIESMKSYTETSPSRTGIRIFVKGTIPKNIKKKIEIYGKDAFVTVTGKRWTP